MSTTEVETHIPLVPEATFMLQWSREAGRSDPIIYLSEGDLDETPRGHTHGRLQIDTSRRLNYVDNRGSRTELATFCGHRRNLINRYNNTSPVERCCFLLNGNGFEDRFLQALQARLRTRIEGAHGAHNTMIVPYDALHAAQIDLESIRPIAITGEQQVSRTRTFELPPVPEGWNGSRAGIHGQTRRVNFQGREWVIEHDQWRGNIWQVRFQPTNGALGWFRLDGRTIRYNEHLLGASVFTADAPNGNHRYISAFDQQENPPMYFLAQLPDGPEVTDYDSAIRALAPPMVHAAEEEGKTVLRHGDIFFIPTSESRESLVLRGTVTKRRAGKPTLQRGGRHGGSRWINAPILRRQPRAVRIFGTGHTADFVAITEEGITFASGTVRHEPYLVPEERDRQPEHAALDLDEGVWYLCIRNTVPSL